MKTIPVFLACIGFAVAASTGLAIDLKESKVTQVINDVDIISAADQKAKPAAVDEIFSMPDILRTGESSRAELVAKDETITRVGANTIFSFDPASRTIDLKQGSLLFHSPHGKGGGTIRTGSATASVLGTTLIVTTTPDGGMKVLNLEGKVKVDFQNKKNQTLKPGQMTFILPGGKELAPIVVFRLDELVKHSLLVHGFDKPLASMPLIQNQIEKQTKLIKSGKATDTGLLVGDSATPNQVEVLDPNSIQNIVNNAGAQTALRVDANLASSSLIDSKIPVPPARIFVNEAFVLPYNSFFAGRAFRGFAGRDITVGSSGPLNFNLSQYAGHPEFDFVAAGDMNLMSSLIFSGLSSANTVSLIGGEQMAFTPGIALTANVGTFEMATAGAIGLNGVQVNNNIGKIDLTSGSTINLDNVAINAAGLTTLTAPDLVRIAWDKSIYFGKTGVNDFNAIVTDPDHGKAIIDATGSLTVNSTSIQAHYLTLNSGDRILLDASGQVLKANGPEATAIFTAPNQITVNHADLSNYGAVNMAANTINLSDVAFGAGSSVLLKSLLGQLNVGSSVPGYVNFIQNVTYGGNPAQNYVNNGGGITVTTLH